MSNCYELIFITYDEGFDTTISGKLYPRLYRMLTELGKPLRYTKLASGRLLIEWPPLFPGTPDPEYLLQLPWPADRRKIVSIATAQQGN